jgi:uncharacterized protein YndB with AHSA1/START domain
MGINFHAPVLAADEVEIAAAPELIWDLIAGINHWPYWNRGVKSASLNGPLAVGTEFRWKSGPNTITSTLQRVERPRLISWTGRALGIIAIHVWRLRPHQDATIVRTEESWEGPLAKILQLPMQRVLERSMDAGLLTLKVEAERRSARSVPFGGTIT